MAENDCIGCQQFIELDVLFTSHTNNSQKRLFIFDWDDTILPSTWLNYHQLNLGEDSQINQEQQKELQKLSDCAIRMLSSAIDVGVVVLITNAEKGWIELSGKKFLPKVNEFLAKHSIKILSARSLYEAKGFILPCEWKREAFREQAKIHLNNVQVWNQKVLKNKNVLQQTLLQHLQSLPSSVDNAHTITRHLPINISVTPTTIPSPPSSSSSSPSHSTPPSNPVSSPLSCPPSNAVSSPIEDSSSLAVSEEEKTLPLQSSTISNAQEEPPLSVGDLKAIEAIALLPTDGITNSEANTHSCKYCEKCVQFLQLTQQELEVIEKNMYYPPHIISLGDSIHERDATLSLHLEFATLVTKSLKLMDKPTLEQLLKQQELVAQCLKDIAYSETALDLCIRCC